MEHLPSDIQDRISDLNAAWKNLIAARTQDGVRLNSDEVVGLEQNIIARKTYLIHTLTKEIL